MPESPSADVLVCERCEGLINSRRRPEICEGCGGRETGWWDTTRHDWYAPDLSPRATDGIWIRGHFEGYYQAGIEQFSNNRDPSAWGFSPVIHDGRLSSARRIHRPPQALTADEILPLRQLRVSKVRVEPAEGSGNVLEGPVEDFRLHHWHEEAGTRLGSSRTDGLVVGRLTGTGYGFIPTPTVRDQPPETPVDRSAEGTEPLLPPSAEPPPGSPDTPPIPPTPPTDPARPLVDEPDTCAACAWWFRLLIATAVWLTCDWKTSLLGGLVIPAIACAWGQGLRNRRRAARETTGWLLWGLALVAMLGWALAALHPDGCRPWAPWIVLPVMLAMFAAQGMGGGAAGCLLRCLLMIGWAATLAFQSGLLVEPCTSLESRLGSLSAPGASRLSHESAPEVAGVPGVAGSPAGAASADSTEAGAGESAQSLLDQIAQRVNAAIGKLNDIFQFDPVADAVSQASQRLDKNQPQRLSADAVLQRPSLLKNCRNSLYFPVASMFDYGDDKLTQDAGMQLARLKPLLAAYPNGRWTITGHADKTGEEDKDGIFRNIDLSQRRAMTVAGELVGSQGWPADRIEIQGVGSRFPLVEADGESPVNRRVEIRLRCVSEGSR